MAKRSFIRRTVRGARRMLDNYVLPGAKTAEAQIDDVLKVLATTRRVLERQRAMLGRMTGGMRRASKRRKKAKAARRRPAARRPAKRSVRRKRRT